MNNVHRAKALLTGDEAKLHYAALEIRMAIEALFYKLLQSYREELPDDLLRRWQPKKIIDAIIECDPDIEHDYTLNLAEEVPQGARHSATQIGRYKAVNRKLIRDYYHKLGYYLHAPMPGKSHDPARMLTFLKAAATRVEEYCQGTTVIANIANFCTVKCDCGRKIKRNSRAVKLKPYIKCPDERCGAEYDLVQDGETKATWRLRRTKLVCPDCETPNYLASHQIRSGTNFICVECGQRYVIQAELIARRIEHTSPAE